MAFDTANPTYQELLARVVQSGTRVVPFVGAGLSAYGNPQQRLPTWRELLTRLVAEGGRLGLIPDAGDAAIEVALQSGRYIEAADRILDALGEPTFRRAVERELDDTDKPTPPSITELVAIGWSLIVTTNLDRMIARAYLERHGRPLTQITSLDTHRLAAALAGTLASSETTLAQIHGDVDTYPSWRLTRSHYEQLLRDPGYVEALKHLFLRQVFFVGFGLQDDDFHFLLETVARIYPAGVGEFYALIARSRRHDPVVRDLIRSSGLRPIFYDVDAEPDPSDPFDGHRQVYECLQHLASTWATTNIWLDVTLKYFPELDPCLVGRDREVKRLAELLVARQACVAQVVGLGGSGKTSLIQQFLADQRVEIAMAGYRSAFGCSFYRADIGQFIQDLALATGGPTAMPLPEQVDRICAHVRLHRTMLLLDGVEAIMDAERRLRNPYVLEIMDSVLRGHGAVVTTARVPLRGGIFEHTATLDVAPLDADEIHAFLDQWGLDGLSPAARARLVEITAGHPLALRILAGVLRGVPVHDAIRTIERSALIDVADEIDPLQENRLARILGSYLHHLDGAEIALLTGSTVFEGPAPYPLIEAALARPYPDTSVNAPLVGRDLRSIVAGLLERRLLTVSTGGELTSHPTVREYFSRRARGSDQSLAPIHRFLAFEYLRSAAPVPGTFDEASPLLIACRHAAKYEDWTLFDDLFRRRLMRGFRNYLCNNLGAWEEALATARVADVASFPVALTPEPAFYPITVARCLKHLGRSSESRAKYFDGLQVAAEVRDPDTAKYVNNLLTLLIWRGELVAAERLVELNIRALSWITEPWKRHWQVEHGFATFGYLKLLQGNLDSAETLFDVAQRAWDDYSGDRLWIFDYYPYHRSELILLADSTNHDDALDRVESLLSVARAQGWPESICRGHIHAAAVDLDRSSELGDPLGFVRATQRLEEARRIVGGMNVPDVEIAYLLSQLKAELVHRDLYGRTSLDRSTLDRLIDRLDALVQTSGLALAAPDAIAARGAVAHLEGSTDIARARYDDALRECGRQGNALAPRSRRSLVGWLGERLGRPGGPPSTASDVDVMGMMGAELTGDWMIRRLHEVASDDCQADRAL